MWSIHTIITGLVSFMNSEEIMMGHVLVPASHCIQLAPSGLQFCLKHDEAARYLFGKELQEMAQQHASLGDSWPPPRRVTNNVDWQTVTTTDSNNMFPSTQVQNTRSMMQTTVNSNKGEDEEKDTTSGKNVANNKKKCER
jgi:hypothetical protein